MLDDLSVKQVLQRQSCGFFPRDRFYHSSSFAFAVLHLYDLLLNISDARDVLSVPLNIVRSLQLVSSLPLPPYRHQRANEPHGHTSAQRERHLYFLVWKRDMTIKQTAADRPNRPVLD